jgi:hypothetical protein
MRKLPAGLLTGKLTLVDPLVNVVTKLREIATSAPGYNPVRPSTAAPLAETLS